MLFLVFGKSDGFLNFNNTVVDRWTSERIIPRGNARLRLFRDDTRANTVTRSGTHAVNERRRSSPCARADAGQVAVTSRRKFPRFSMRRLIGKNENVSTIKILISF